MKKVFMDGAISSSFIADSIQKHSMKTEIGAHSIFLGQVRADQKADGLVTAIEYSTNESMAMEIFHEIRERAFEKHPLTCLHIYHSLGLVKVGEVCLFVFTSSKHRNAAVTACSEIVEEIKAKVPIWGKEILENGKAVWKVNT